MAFKNFSLLMQGFPNGLPMDDAEAVIVNVAYGLVEMHRDGIIHRHVCLSTVLVPDAACFDTVRSAPAQQSASLSTQSHSCQHSLKGVTSKTSPVCSQRSHGSLALLGTAEHPTGLICGGAEQAGRRGMHSGAGQSRDAHGAGARGGPPVPGPGSAAPLPRLQARLYRCRCLPALMRRRLEWHDCGARLMRQASIWAQHA